MRERPVLLCRAGLIAAAAFGLYLARVRGPYHFDDWVTPVGDPASQSLSAFASHLGRTLRPLSKLGFALEGSLGWGNEPALRRAVSALFHGASSGLLFLLAARLGAGFWAAAVAALLFALHPIHAEMVWALAGRGAVMALAFLLAAILAQLHRRVWLAAGLLCAACLCRETSVLGVLPLAALELAHRPRDLRTLFRRLEPSLTVVLLAVAFVLQNARYRELIDYSAHGRPFAWSMAGQVEAIPLGLSLYVRPSALSIDHGEALAHSFFSLSFWLGAAVYVALVALLVFGMARHRSGLAVGAALTLALLLPTQSLVPKLDPLSERPFAAALSGVVLMASVTWGRSGFAKKPLRRVLLGGAAVALLLLARATLARGALYRSDVALWRDAADKSVVNARPYLNLALALREQGRIEEAARAIARAGQIDPFDSEIRALATQLEASLSSQHRR